MNYGSPLSKDHRVKKEEDTPKKDKPKISVGTAKRILKSPTVGIVATAWLNHYIENRVQGECLPKSFLSNDILAELARAYGADSEKFLEATRVAYRREFSIPNPELASERAEKTPDTEESS
jgi:hypothetical protein